VQYQANPEIVAIVPPHSFMPRPAVDSAVIQIKPLPKPSVDCDKDLLFKIIHGAFNQRRKTLPNALAAAELGPTKAQWIDIIKANGISENIRGEALGLDSFARLADAVHGFNI